MNAWRVVTLVAILLLVSGCNRGWTFGWLRGDPCNTCGNTVLEGTRALPPAQLPEPLP